MSWRFQGGKQYLLVSGENLFPEGDIPVGRGQIAKQEAREAPGGLDSTVTSAQPIPARTHSLLGPALIPSQGSVTLTPALKGSSPSPHPQPGAKDFRRDTKGQNQQGRHSAGAEGERREAELKIVRCLCKSSNDIIKSDRKQRKLILNFNCLQG